MKEKLTTQIDSYLKRAFESTRDIHGKNFTDILEAAIYEILINIQPIETLEREIKQTELDQEIRRQKIAELKILQEKQVKIVHHGNGNGNGHHDKELENFRNEQFEKSKDSILKIYPDLNYSKLVYTWKFNDVNECKDWFNSKIREIQYL